MTDAGAINLLISGNLVIFGLGYSGLAVARAAIAAGYQVTGTSRGAAPEPTPPSISVVGFAAARAALDAATHLLSTAPPGAAGDPVLALYDRAIHAAPNLRWLGYLSTTGVYGDRGGAWVDEATAPAPTSERGARRVAAERDWVAAGEGRPVDLFRLAGIYGPGRSVIDDLRAGRARRVIKPGHAFGRIYRDDIARAVLAAMSQSNSLSAGPRVLNLIDDLPAETADMVAEAAGLLGLPIPPGVPFAEACASMSPMARSFWEENRKVANTATKAALGIAWRYPTYHEGLRAILAEEAGQRVG